MCEDVSCVHVRQESFPLSSFGFVLKKVKKKKHLKIQEKMQIKTLIHPLQGCSPSLIILNKTPALARFQSSFSPPSLRFFTTNILHRGVKTSCISPGKELIFDENCDNSISLSKNEEEKEEEEEEVEMEVKRGGLEKQSIWSQMKEIVMFTGPATGLWLCGPLMSLIDTAVIGQGSSVELAALGPGTVMCDYLTYVFMFLSIATSNMVATSLARQDKNEVQHQISVLLFVGLACGFLMLLFTRFFGSWALTAFTGPRNVHLVPAANTYVQIRSFAWPAVLVGLVAQSASLGMKDSLGPLKALAVASAINGIGDVALCSFLGYGIAGAAWATMVSQVVSAYMMIQSLNNKGYNAFSFSVPSTNELATILGLAGPVFITMIAKVAFYSLIIYFATSMGTNTVAAHQVMIQTYGMCSVCGEPLSQTAQSFMPELIYGVNRSLVKARMLLKSLLLIGSTLGLVLGTIGASVPWFFPNIFTSDKSVIQEMHKVLIPYILAIVVSPSTHSLEGTLLAGRDVKFFSISMSGCFLLGALVLLFASRGYGLPGCWFALVCFQSARFLLSLWRLLSPDGTLYSEDLNRYKMEKLKAA
ncbi:protein DETOXIFICATION 46, chloroplastic isoform X1 [Citrus clementina]|nr:protein DETOXIFICATION 46, chloroplastic isoform X1 [Citrus x clementina]XP_024033660.1 protein DETOXIFICATION 46, chloroplastic isoform X1 [Citrus x clementina]